MGSGECNERCSGAAFTNPNFFSRAGSENLRLFWRNVLTQLSQEHGCRQSTTGCSSLIHRQLMETFHHTAAFMWGCSFIMRLAIQPLLSGAVQIGAVWPTTADVEITDDRRSTGWWGSSSIFLLWHVFDVKILHRNMMLCNKNRERKGKEGWAEEEWGDRGEKKRREGKERGDRSAFSTIIDSVEYLQPSAAVDLGRGFSRWFAWSNTSD